MHGAMAAYRWKSPGMGVTTGTSILLPSTVYKGDRGRLLDMGPPEGVLCVGHKRITSSMGQALHLLDLVLRGGSDEVTISDGNED